MHVFRPASPLLKKLGWAVLAVLVLLPSVASQFPYMPVLSIELMISVLFATSLHFIMGPGGMASFGHAAYFGLGAYGAGDNLHDYLIPSVGGMPRITVHIIEDGEPLGPYGAKGVGEPALCATPPAILNAIHDASGVRVHQIPATPDRVRKAIQKKAAL